jgi:hypothetical protein
VCSKIECKDELLVPKFDILSNHANKRKTKVAMLGVQIRKLIFLKKSQHVKNKAIYVGMARKNVFHLVAQGDGNHNRQKIVQFTYVMHLLKKG